MLTDRELLELLVEKVTGLEGKMGSMENKFETRFDSIEKRMDSMEKRMGSFEKELQEFRAEVNTKLDDLQAQTDVIAIHVLKHSEQLRMLSRRPV